MLHSSSGAFGGRCVTGVRTRVCVHACGIALLYPLWCHSEFIAAIALSAGWIKRIITRTKAVNGIETMTIMIRRVQFNVLFSGYARFLCSQKRFKNTKDCSCGDFASHLKVSINLDVPYVPAVHGPRNCQVLVVTQLSTVLKS